MLGKLDSGTIIMLKIGDVDVLGKCLLYHLCNGRDTVATVHVHTCMVYRLLKGVCINVVCHCTQRESHDTHLYFVAIEPQMYKVVHAITQWEMLYQFNWGISQRHLQFNDLHQQHGLCKLAFEGSPLLKRFSVAIFAVCT